jgi:hypothetical protein
MSLRTYFDTALNENTTTSREELRRSLGVTVTAGDQAARNLQHARDELEKLRKKRAERAQRREHARA